MHKALASLDQRPKRTPRHSFIFQSTRLSRASTIWTGRFRRSIRISIHKALASLDATRYSGLNRRKYFNPQGSREPRQQNYPNLLHIPPNILCIMLFSPQFNQFSPFTQPAFTAFSSVFQVRISLAFHVSLAFAPGLKGSQLTETNSTYILHNPSFPAYILHAAKPLPPPPDTLSIQASFVPDIWLPA
ncbi:hypothetical protein HMPREF1095_00604 [Enterocloster bolteae 90A5]|nr:hypothetical protein HMPREF1095_00604 [Enterocloster bolteae 90A5]ENZ68243.1 hypothetical protein HMPREF1096_03418 [Enterocloster bolteae 90B7]